MHNIPVHMLAFQPEYCTRNVVIETLPEKIEDILEEVFKNGQNDFVNVPNRCSLSSGDVIEYQGDKYLICMVSFRKMTETEFQDFLKLPRQERTFSAMLAEPNV